jgi:hypothetical protein
MMFVMLSPSLVVGRVFRHGLFFKSGGKPAPAAAGELQPRRHAKGISTKPHLLEERKAARKKISLTARFG